MRKSTLEPEHSPRSGSALRDWCALGLILAVSLATSACGFKPRGRVEIPPEFSPLFVQAPQRSLARNELIRQLQGSQVPLATAPRKARALVRIINERRSFYVTAVDHNGKVLAQELHYGLTFDAVTAGGKQLVPQQSLDLTRNYENPDLAVFGKQLESRMIYSEMFRDAASRILNRLWAALRSKKSAGTDNT